MAKGKTLIIVESPNKCASIKKYLGEGYEVLASVGHVRDLAHKNGIDIKNGFKPTWENSEDKKDVIKKLKEAYKNADDCIIMTDGDNEGSAIGFHVCEILGIDPKKAKRAITLEITKKAVNEAVKNPGKLDMNVVDAAISRRLLDRIFGFTLSPVLWNKIKLGLSAGRVQSPGLRLVVEKYKENQKFSADPEFKVTAIFESKDKKNRVQNFKAVLNTKFKTKKEAESFLNSCIDKEFFVKSVEKKPGKKSPSAPFTTSSLQMECSRKFGMSPQKSMSVAQELFASGKITYHRSDSVTLSEEALDACQVQVIEKFGKSYSNKKQYTSKKESTTGGAHECVRPVDLSKPTIEGGHDEQKVYELIYKRTLASQMSDARFDNTVVHISAKGLKEEFVGKGTTLVFDGFLQLYQESVEEKETEDEEENNKTLPEMEVKQIVLRDSIIAGQVYSRPPALYTEASLIKKLEELQIGRPSTYASILSVIQERGYCEKKDTPAKKRDITTLTLNKNKIDEQVKSENFGKEVNKLVPTDIGIVVNDFLCKNFANLVSYDFTANMELSLDLIAEGKIKGQKMLEDFYGPFMELINEAKGSDRPGARLVGVDPISGKNVYSRIGRFGPMIQLGESVKQEKGAEKEKGDVKFAKLPEGLSIDTITLKECLGLLSWPKLLGEYKKLPIEVNEGKYGPYVKYNSKFYSISLPKETITLEEAVEIIKAKDSGESTGAMAKFGEISVLKGRYGPYIRYKNNNFKIPADIDAEAITKEQCEEIVGDGKKKATTYKKFTKKKSK